MYARVSTDRQQHAQTIEQQVNQLREYVAAQENWTLEEAHIFRDDGYSGARLNRPGLDALRDQVARGAFDVVVITAPDRLARNYVHQMVVLEELERRGVRVIFVDRPVSDDPHEHLVVQIRGAVAEYERTLIAERMRRGRLAKLRSGLLLPWPRAPYGYRLDPERPRDPALVRVEPAEAAIVQELFADYAAGGVTLYALATRLTARQVPTPRGRPRWLATTIRCLLTNPAYMGLAAFGKTRTTLSQQRSSALKPLGSGESARHRPNVEWITVPVPPLVSTEQFDLAQRRLASNRQEARRNTTHEYLLRARVSCGLCQLNCTGRQRGWRGSPYRYYVCMGKAMPNVSDRAERCRARYAPAQQLDELVWDDLCQVLLHPEHLGQALLRAQAGAWLPDELRRRQATLQGIRASLERQRQRLLEAYLAEVIDLPGFERKDAELRRRQEDLIAQERTLMVQDHYVPEVSALARSMTELCQRLGAGLKHATFAQRRELVELLIDRVIVANGDVEIRYVIPTSPSSEHVRFCHLRSDYFSSPHMVWRIWRHIAQEVGKNPMLGMALAQVRAWIDRNQAHLLHVVPGGLAINR
jgi:site-specific DNA recombinase